MGGGWWVVVLKGTLVFCFGPNLKLRFWPRPKLNKNVVSMVPSVRLGNFSYMLKILQCQKLEHPPIASAVAELSPNSSLGGLR